MRAYYLVTPVFLAFSFIFYLPFRGTMPDYLRRRYRIGKSRLKKQPSGFRNRLWYESLHRQYGFPVLYLMNKLFTLLFAAAVLLHLTLGWMKIPALVFCILYSAATLLLILLDAFSYLETLRAEFGRIWVLFGINHRKGIDSVLFIPVSALMLLTANLTVIREMTAVFFP